MNKKQFYLNIALIFVIILVGFVSIVSSEYTFERTVEVTYVKHNVICITLLDGFTSAERRFEFNDKSLPAPSTIELSVGKEYRKKKDLTEYVYTTYDIQVYNLPVVFKDNGTDAFRLKSEGLTVIDWQSF